MIKFEDKWFIAEGQENELPLVIRGRGELSHLIGLEDYDKILRIAWNFEGDTNFNFPSEELEAKMDSFQETIYEALEKDNLCIFYCVYTHNGLQEWAAYTSDVEKAAGRFNEALKDAEQLPLEIFVEEDPKWEDYQRMIEGTGQNNS